VIAFRDCLPLLRKAGKDYSAIRQDWLCSCLRRAAKKSGYDRWWPAEHVASGIICSLGTTYPGNVITAPQLRSIVLSVLKTIGYAELALHFQVLELPFELSLSNLAQEAGPGYELAFFALLKERVQPALSNRASNLDFYGLQPCVLQLRSKRTWSWRCSELQTEIVEFLRAQLLHADLQADILLTIR
jgi:hypothetical protein